MNREDGLRNLRVALSRVKKHLADPNSLEANRNEVTLHQSSQHIIDVRRFELLIKQIDRHSHDSLAQCDSCLGTLRKIAQLYQGYFLDRFVLEGSDVFEEWLFVWRERYHVMGLTQLERLAEAEFTLGELGAAELLAQRQIKLNPLKEKAYQLLMRISAERGNRTEALRRFQVCKAKLESELGVSPEEKTIHLKRVIESGEYKSRLKAQPELTQALGFSKLPETMTPFIGREGELEEIGRRLGDPHHRLITIMGPGGMGKTRLAIKVAEAYGSKFKDRSLFVSLAPIQTVNAAINAIATALGLSVELRDYDTYQQLLRELHLREMLLVLDNFEHLLDLVNHVLEILETCPKISILTTSRERLNCHIEDVFYLEGLPVPSPIFDKNISNPAISLFEDRAKRVEKRFELSVDNYPHIVRICHLVAGMPLGIELAAAWVEDFNCRDISSSIAKNLDFLSVDFRDITERHRSLRAAFMHSWDLLSESEKESLANLSVFNGHFTFEYATKINAASVPTIKRLRHKSLIQKVGSNRFKMHVLIRQYAVEKLESSPEQKNHISTKHSQFFLKLLADQQWRLQQAEQEESLQLIELNHENIIFAWEWAIETLDFNLLNHSRDALMIFYLKRNRLKEAILICQRGYNTQISVIDPPAKHFYAMLLAWNGVFNNQLGEHSLAREQLQKAHTYLRTVHQDVDLDRAFILFQLGQAYFPVNLEQAHHHYEMSLDFLEPHHIPWQKANIYQALASLHYDRAEMDQAQAHVEKALKLRHEVGLGRDIADTLSTLVFIKLALHELDIAINYAKEAIQICRRVDAPRSLAEALNQLSVAYLWAGRIHNAIPLIEESIELFNKIGATDDEGFCLNRLALYHTQLGRYELGQAIAHQTLKMGEILKSGRITAWSYKLIGLTLMGQGDFEGALSPMQKSRALFQLRGNRAGVDLVDIYLAFIDFYEGDISLAHKTWHEALQEAVSQKSYMRMVISLAAISLILTSIGDLYHAIALHDRLMQETSFISRSNWFADIAGKYVSSKRSQIQYTEESLFDRQDLSQISIWRLGEKFIHYSQPDSLNY